MATSFATQSVIGYYSEAENAQVAIYCIDKTREGRSFVIANNEVASSVVKMSGSRLTSYTTQHETRNIRQNAKHDRVLYVCINDNT